MSKAKFSDDNLIGLRKRAEEVLSYSNLSEMDVSEDVRRLLSELHVHQVELEMQNDELRQAQLQLAKEREKYVDLYNFAPVAYFSVDQDDVILDMNIAAAELLGQEPRYVLHRPITPYLTPNSLQTFVQHRNVARELRTPQTCELTIRRRNGDQVFVQVRTIFLESDTERPLWRSVMTDITERKQMENQLRQQATWKGLISDAVIATNSDLVITEWNEAAEQIYGWNPEEAIGHNIDALLKTEFWETTQAKAQAVLQATGVWRGPVRQEHKNGREIYIEASVTILKDGNGKIVGGITVNRDITERKKIEEKLRFQAHLLDDVEQAIIVTDPTARIIYWNPFAEKMYGWSAEEAVGKTTLELIATEDSLRQGESLMELVNQGKSWTGEYLTRHRDGIIFPVQVTMNSLFGPDGCITGIIGVSTDISVRKRAEDALRASEQKFRSVIEQSSDGIILADEYGNIIAWNKSQEQISGVPREEVIGGPAWEAQLRIALPEEQTPENREKLRQVVEAIFQKRESPAFGKVFERNIRRPDGTIRIVETVSYPIFGENHFWIGSVMRDITERKQAEEALQQSEDLFAKVFNASPSGIVISRVVDGRFVDLNQAACDIYGYKREDLLGHTSLELGIINDETRRKLIESLQTQKALRNYEVVVRTQNAEERALLCSMEIMEIKGEQCLLTTMNDITERKQAEEALRTSEERFRSLVHSLSDIIFTLDTEQRHTGVFGEWVEKAGLAPEFFIGKTARDLFGGESAAAHEAANARALAGESTSYEWSAPSQAGTIYYQTMVSPLRDIRGNVTGLVGVGRDITERKRAEEALRESEQRYRSLFKDNHAVMLLINPATRRIVDANPAACAYYGYKHEEITNLQVTDINMLGADAVSQEMRKAQTSRQNHFFFKHRLKNGEIRDVEVYSGSIHISGEDLLYSIVYDITERQKAEKNHTGAPAHHRVCSNTFL
jgi:PAS domain S-box-containing protein